ncbi:MAG: DUF192 domain-containing protein [Alphaproteobacteria bacterium]|nr:MAG: DUF192 domain-containing protein [Alphaproteobacteria bacterium]
MIFPQHFGRIFRRMRLVAAATMIACGIAAGAGSPPDIARAQEASGKAPQHLARSPLVIETVDHRRHLFCVEVADDDRERAIGLMHRRSLDAHAGMLFDYATARRVAMWMKNTLIPLDILFVRANGRVANIAHGRPLDLTTLPSRGRVLAALELKGGISEQLNIRPGDLVHHPIFGTWDEKDAEMAKPMECAGTAG